ncbi:GH-E family nuclease [Shewanella sp. YLB-07]|uniref:GH-E family nuclease n=1 Tax=Shewanella sp. YLB-07 TaxID=2601268 RepID=UPI00128C7835|nr:GH-E family nuclease [Shewanella sp. YLB-07]MPY23822.1 hypothetical protein [Shewanella sp. YLB-07]
MSIRLATLDSLMLHDAVLIESDLSSLSDGDWQAITPSGHSLDKVKTELEQGELVVLTDTPRSPLFAMEQGKPTANSGYGNGISAQTLNQLTRRFESRGSSTLYSFGSGRSSSNKNDNLDPAPPLDYVADTSRVRVAENKPKPALISDDFGKPPPKLELELCYDDSEKTYASNVPYSVIFSDPANTVIKGVLNDKGWAMVEGGPNYPAQVIFGDEADKAEAEKALESQYKQLDTALNDVAIQIAQQTLDAKEVAKKKKLFEVTESFKSAVDSKIAELNAQSEEFDNLSYLAQSWELAKSAKEGASNGFTEYLPDLGDFGKLMDAADIDITMLIEAISTGNINDLEDKLKEWNDRGGQGLSQARKTMETLILLLCDPTSREMLASIPKRILAALPEDQIAELTAYQMTQMGMDTTVVVGGTAVGTLAGGVGGPVAAGILFTATTARKGGKALESTINIVADISTSLKKVNNQHDIKPYKKENTLPLAAENKPKKPSKNSQLKSDTSSGLVQPNSLKVNVDGPSTEVKFGSEGQVYAKLPSSDPTKLRWQRMNGTDKSNRNTYMGATPGKESRVGLEVQKNMRENGTLVGNQNNREVLGEDGKWHPITKTDMGHVESAVEYWNRVGRYQGAKSPEVRKFMNDPSNYILEPSSINRSNGASLGKKYLPVASEEEKLKFSFDLDEID